MRRLDIATFIEGMSLVNQERDLINDIIRMALDRVYNFHEWPYYVQEGTLRTVAVYNDGEVDVTNGSTTVTGTTTAFTDDMVGRKFRVSGEKAYYKIAEVVSGTELTLAEEYRGDTDTGLDYEIFKDEYRLAADVGKYKIIRQLENGMALVSIYPDSFDTIIPTPESYGEPTYEIFRGTKLDIYNDGTVTATGKTITGSGTEWTGVEGLGRCSKVRIGNNVYTVKSVDSDTQLTVYENVIAVAGATAHEVILDNLILQLYNIPDSDRLLYYSYFRKPVPLANDYDVPDMPSQWIYLLKWAGLSEALALKGDIQRSENVYEGKFVRGLQQMKLSIGSFAPNRRYQRKSADSLGRTNRGVEKPTFDIRYSL